MKVKMLNDQILIKKIIEDYSMSKGGIVLSKNPEAPRTCKAEVIAVGPGKKSLNGDLMKTIVEEGDIVRINSKIGTEIIDEDGVKLYVITEPQIFFVYDDDKECKCDNCKGDCK